MADMDDIFQVEMSHKSGQVVSVMVHIVPIGRLGRASMATAVMGYHAIAMMQEEQHLRVPIIGRKRPAMAEHNRLTFTPVFVVDRDAILCRDRVHLLLLAVAFGFELRTWHPLFAAEATTFFLRCALRFASPGRSPPRHLN